MTFSTKSTTRQAFLIECPPVHADRHGLLTCKAPGQDEHAFGPLTYTDGSEFWMYNNASAPAPAELLGDLASHVERPFTPPPRPVTRRSVHSPTFGQMADLYYPNHRRTSSIGSLPSILEERPEVIKTYNLLSVPEFEDTRSSHSSLRPAPLSVSKRNGKLPMTSSPQAPLPRNETSWYDSSSECSSDYGSETPLYGDRSRFDSFPPAPSEGLQYRQPQSSQNPHTPYILFAWPDDANDTEELDFSWRECKGPFRKSFNFAPGRIQKLPSIASSPSSSPPSSSESPIMKFPYLGPVKFDRPRWNSNGSTISADNTIRMCLTNESAGPPSLVPSSSHLTVPTQSPTPVSIQTTRDGFYFQRHLSSWEPPAEWQTIEPGRTLIIANPDLIPSRPTTSDTWNRPASAKSAKREEASSKESKRNRISRFIKEALPAISENRRSWLPGPSQR